MFGDPYFSFQKQILFTIISTLSKNHFNFFLKISMSGELTTAKTQLAALLNEVTSLRQREVEVSSQLSKVTSEAEKFKNELERTKDSHTGLIPITVAAKE